MAYRKIVRNRLDGEHWASLAALGVVAQERIFTRTSATIGVLPSVLSHAMRRAGKRVHIQRLARSMRSASTIQVGERLPVGLALRCRASPRSSGTGGR